MDENDLRKIEKQNEVIISLYGRIAVTPEKVRDIVTKKKQNPEKYIEGYNACDGVRNLNELAEIIEVKQGTLSPILQEWAELGIVYEIEKSKGRFYRKLFPISTILQFEFEEES